MNINRYILHSPSLSMRTYHNVWLLPNAPSGSVAFTEPTLVPILTPSETWKMLLGAMVTGLFIGTSILTIVLDDKEG